MILPTKRIILYPFWKVSDWGLSFYPLHHLFNFFDKNSWGPLPLISKGGDEWGNPSLNVIFPLFCRIVIFYGKEIDRSTWYLSGAIGNSAVYCSPDFKREALIPFDGDFDSLFEKQPNLEEAEVLRKASYVEDIED